MMEDTSLLIVEKGADGASVIMLCRRSAIMGHIGGVKTPRRGSGEEQMRARPRPNSEPL